MKLVAGHLTLKNGRYYAVLNYRNAGGQRKTKWISLGLPEKGNKRKAEAELARLRAEFEPPKEAGDLSSDMLFADYLLEWLEIAKGRLAVATYSSYAAMIKKPVGPYFRQRNLTLRELEARHLQMFYSEMLRKVKPNTVIHYHAIIHSALKYAVKTDMLIQNVADKVDRPRKNSFQPVFLSADEMQKMFEALRGTKLELPVLVAAFYGLRRGEVVGLKWDGHHFRKAHRDLNDHRRQVSGVRAAIRQDQVQSAHPAAHRQLPGILYAGERGAGAEQAGLRQLLQL